MHDNWIEIQFQTTGEVLGKSKFVTNLRQANKMLLPPCHIFKYDKVVDKKVSNIHKSIVAQ